MKKFSFTHKNRRTVLIIFSWICLWQILAAAVGNSILFVGPAQVIGRLVLLLPQKDFWLSVLCSFQKICTGFLAAFFLGIFMGRLAFSVGVIKEFLAPAISFIKSVPVASFVILALIWTGSKNLSVLISFLVVFPVIYTNTITGLAHTDRELLEMAQIFHICGWRKFRGLYWPSLLPYLTSGCKTALGMGWKSGIAAEVIGVPEHTIGEQLYLSKIYLDTAGLFAWTLVIIAASAIFEAVFLKLLKQTGKGRLGAAIPFLPGTPGHTGRPKKFSIFSQTAQEGISGKQPANGKNKEITLTVSRLSKSFGGLSVLKEADFSFTSCQPCCLMGASGSGKTTLLRILMGLEKADSGSIYLNAADPCAVRPELGLGSAYLHIAGSFKAESKEPHLATAAVFQENRLCEQFSPVDNLRLALPWLSADAIKKELSRLLPEECLTRPVSTLSGGMKRRTAITRALLARSNTVIMDEPFTGLDGETKETVIRYILEKTAGKLLILSTHQEEDILLMGGRRFDLPSAGPKNTPASGDLEDF